MARFTDSNGVVTEGRNVRRLVRNDLGPLQDLLLICCPATTEHRESHDGTPVVSLPLLADAIECKNETIYKWIKNDNTVPPDKAARCVSVSEGRVRLEDFAPYVFK